MKYIISGTDREGSNTLKVSLFIQALYKELGEEVELIDLRVIGKKLTAGPLYGQTLPADLQMEFNKITHADGLIVVTPEYNGSMPGILKYYIDHMKFPESFEYRPVCFVGLGGMFGAMRPVEHLQGVFGYRNAFIYPQRVFLQNVHKIIKDGQITEPLLRDLLAQQAKGFQQFTQALKQAGLDANSYLAKKVAK